MAGISQQKPEKVLKGLAHNGLTDQREAKHGMVCQDPADAKRSTMVSLHKAVLPPHHIRTILNQAKESADDWEAKMQRV